MKKVVASARGSAVCRGQQRNKSVDTARTYTGDTVVATMSKLSERRPVVKNTKNSTVPVGTLSGFNPTMNRASVHRSQKARELKKGRGTRGCGLLWVGCAKARPDQRCRINSSWNRAPLDQWRVGGPRASSSELERLRASVKRMQ
jgi:hypothetical protein